ncbi:MAG: hypothetical protein CBD27_12565 [Rhodospirillaceae bacterium TMED167]|nr:hypothetical protein [Rhodospirillaceae bacterium]OUW23144.1 MAG: hypothetical protein CBD27_12565 [Rhodospirillaceae bacterium TMED167]
MGMEGCALYTCFGAGQKVSQRLFSGTDWRNSPEIAQDISSEFYKLKELFELIWVLKVTGSVYPNGPERESIERQINALETYAALDLEATQALDVDRLRRDSQADVDAVYFKVTSPAETD